MDDKSVRASVRFQEMSRDYHNGGYFSDEVNERVDIFATLSEETQQGLFRYTFNAVYEAAQQVQNDPRYAGHTLNLIEEGLGLITVITTDDEALPGNDDSPAVKSVNIFSPAFEPTSASFSSLRAIGDKDAMSAIDAAHMVRTGSRRWQSLNLWDDPVFANDDGSFPDGNVEAFGEVDIVFEYKRLLEKKETLDVALAALAKSRKRSVVRDLVPGIWRLTGEVSDNPLERIGFTARVLAGATVARVEDWAESREPAMTEQILAYDARAHIGAMAMRKGLKVPESFTEATHYKHQVVDLHL